MEVNTTDDRERKMPEKKDREMSKSEEMRPQPSQGAPRDMVKVLEIMQDPTERTNDVLEKSKTSLRAFAADPACQPHRTHTTKETTRRSTVCAENPAVEP